MPAPARRRDTVACACSRWLIGDEDARVDGVDELVEAVVTALESDDSWSTRSTSTVDALAVVLAEALVRAGLRARCEAPLRAGGRALLVTTGDPGALTVAVVPAACGATDALRARVRRLAGHGEVDAVVVASPRARHRVLVGEAGGVPLRVARLPVPW
jgi:hypothetical protein